MSNATVLHVGFALLLGVLVGVFAFAMWKGDLPERAGASVNLAAGLLASGMQFILDADAQPVAMLAIDAALAVCFLFLALRYASLWLGAALLLQAVQFSLHAYYLIVGAHHDLNYKIINNLDTSGINLAIVIGTAAAWRRRILARATADAS